MLAHLGRSRGLSWLQDDGNGLAAIEIDTAIYFWQIDAEPTYHIAVPQSWARSFLEFLKGSAAEFGIAMLPPLRR
jgi:hypothetical protein